MPKASKAFNASECEVLCFIEGIFVSRVYFANLSFSSTTIRSAVFLPTPEICESAFTSPFATAPRNALTLIPLADFTAISFTAPMFLTALAMVFLREPIHAYRWTALAMGFVGVLITVGPQVTMRWSGMRDLKMMRNAMVSVLSSMTIRTRDRLVRSRTPIAASRSIARLASGTG